MKPRGFWKPLDRAELSILEWTEKTRFSGVIEDATRAITVAGEHGAVWYLVAGVAAAADEPRRSRWLRAGALVAALYGANTLLKLVARRQRPPIAAIGTETDLSFPSSHAVTSFAAAALFSSIEPRARLPLYFAAFDVTGSRLHFCVHYPSDLIVGGLLGEMAGRAVAPLTR